MNIEAKGIIGYLSADCLHVKPPIYHGTSESVLSVACAHLEGGGNRAVTCLPNRDGDGQAVVFTGLLGN